MSAELFTNDAETTLAVAMASGDATLTVSGNLGFPSTGNFRIRIDNEIMLVTAVAGGGTNWTVTRAVEACQGVQTAVSHSSGAKIQEVLTAVSLVNIIVANSGGGGGTISLSGDVSGSGTSSIVVTLDTVNSNTGSFGSSTAIPNFNVNGKGLITAAGTSAVVAPAGTLTGTTLASNVVVSSLTTVGTIAFGIWQGTAIGAKYGGTGLTTIAAHGVMIGAGTNNVNVAATGTAGQLLIDQGSGNDPSFNPVSGDATLTSAGVVTLKNTGTPGTYNQVSTDAEGRVTNGIPLADPLAYSTAGGF